MEINNSFYDVQQQPDLADRDFMQVYELDVCSELVLNENSQNVQNDSIQTNCSGSESVETESIKILIQSDSFLKKITKKFLNLLTN